MRKEITLNDHANISSIERGSYHWKQRGTTQHRQRESAKAMTEEEASRSPTSCRPATALSEHEAPLTPARDTNASVCQPSPTGSIPHPRRRMEYRYVALYGMPTHEVYLSAEKMRPDFSVRAFFYFYFFVLFRQSLRRNSMLRDLAPTRDD